MAQLFDQGSWFVKPRTGLGFDTVKTDGYTASGGGGLGLTVDGSNDTYFNVQPAIEIGGEFTTGDILARPNLVLGVTQSIGDPAPSTTARLTSGGGDLPGFTATTKLDRTRFDIGASIDIFSNNSVVVTAGAFGSFSENSTGYGGMLEVAIPF